MTKPAYITECVNHTKTARVWNPLKLVDPDGNDWYEYIDNETKEKKITWTECHSQTQLDNVHENAKYLGLTVEVSHWYNLFFKRC